MAGAEHGGADAVPPGLPRVPGPGLLKGFGHIGLGGTLGWADPATASGFAFVHNRLLTPMVLDMASFAGPAHPLRNAISAARHGGQLVVPKYGARYRESAVPRKGGGPSAPIGTTPRGSGSGRSL